jgi:hypothetical protein
MTSIDKLEPNNPYLNLNLSSAFRLQAFELDLSQYGEFRDGQIEFFPRSNGGKTDPSGNYSYIYGFTKDLVSPDSSASEAITGQIERNSFHANFLKELLGHLETYYYQEADLSKISAQSKEKNRIQTEALKKALSETHQNDEFLTILSKSDLSKLATNETKKLIELLNTFDNISDDRSRAYLAGTLASSAVNQYGSSSYIKDLEFQVLKDSIKMLSEGASASTVELYLSNSKKEIEFLSLAKVASDSGDEDLASVYDKLASTAFKLREEFLNGMLIKEVGGDETSDSLAFYKGNFDVLTGRLKDEMLSAIDRGASFEDLALIKGSNEAYTSITEEFDTITTNLIDHAKSNKSISQIMYENAERAIDINRDKRVSDDEVADSLIRAGRASLTGSSEQRFDLNNDGTVDSTEYDYIVNKLKAQNLKFSEIQSALNFVDADADKQISVSEVNNALENFRTAYNTRNRIADFSGDGVVAWADFQKLWNIVGRDNGIDPNSFDRDSILGSILAGSAINRERATQTLEDRNNALDAFKDTAGQKWSNRAASYREYAYENWALNYDNWFNNIDANHAYHATVVPQWTTAEEAEAFTEIKLGLIQKQERLVNTIKDQGDYWNEIRPQHFMVVKDVHRSGIIVHGGSVQDSEQIGTLWDNQIVFDAKYFANRHGISIDLTDDLESGILVNSEKEKNANLADLYAQVSSSSSRLINYKYAYRWGDDSKAELAVAVIDQFAATALEAEEALRESASKDDPVYREIMDKFYAQYDLLVGLFTDDAATKKAVNLVDKDRDNQISLEEGDLIIRNIEKILLKESYDAAYDFDGDGQVNEYDYDILDNVIGYRNNNGILGLYTQLAKTNDAVDFYKKQNEKYGTLSESDRTKNQSTLRFFGAEYSYDKEIEEVLQRRRFTLARKGERELAFAQDLSRLDDLRDRIEDKIQKGISTQEITEYAELKELKEQIGTKLEKFALSIEGDSINVFMELLQTLPSADVVEFYQENYRIVEKELKANLNKKPEDTKALLGIINSAIKDHLDELAGRTDLKPEDKVSLKQELEYVAERINRIVDTRDKRDREVRQSISLVTYLETTKGDDIDKIIEEYKYSYRQLEKEASKESEKANVLQIIENLRAKIESLRSNTSLPANEKSAKIADLEYYVSRLSDKID